MPQLKLIIAEKPSLAKNIATALGVTKKNDGYFENDKYLISWAFGHLYSLKNVDDYVGKKTSWKDVQLPFIPNPFEFKLKTQKDKITGVEEQDKGVKKQVEIIKKLAERPSITEIVNAGDADREGQIIIDIIINEIKIKKNITRLWLPEQTESTIRKQIENLEKNSKYYNLAQEGYARTYMDWLFGINLTRYVSIKVNKLLPIGRVLIPVVKYIYDRDLEIRNFVKTKYFQLESKTEKDGVAIPLILKSKKFQENERDNALELAASLNKLKAVVKSIEKKEIKKNPGKLFSLSNLQSHLSKKNKIDFNTSLEVIQSLYEKGLITYPRTNTEYLAENEKGKIKEILSTLNGHNVIFKDTKKIFDDSKIESHSALTITTKKPGSLTGNEAIVYNAILNRFISNFLNEETITEKVTMTIAVGEEEFKLNGEAIKQEGFYKYEPEKFENQLPQLKKGEEFSVEFIPAEKETTPPKKVSEEDLAKYLKNPFKKDGDSEDEEYKAILQGVEIGTEATRTGIVENAKKYQYISQKGSNYSIESLGEKLIEILEKLNINMYKEKSVEFSKLQKKVFKGEAKLEDLTTLTTNEITEIIKNNVQIPKFVAEYNGPPREDKREVLGKCPKCGSNIYEGEKAYYCDGYKNDPRCNNSVFKNNKLIPNIGKEDALSLLGGKEVLFKDIKSSKGNIFSAYFILVEEGQYCNLKLTKFLDTKNAVKN